MGVVLVAPASAAENASSAPASAATASHGSSSDDRSGIRVVAQGQTADGGWVKYTGVGEVVIDGTSGGVGAQTVVSAGGGTWAYGSTRNAIGQKVCYSQYQHVSVAHGSSVQMDDWDSDWVGAGYVSDARVSGFTNTVCEAWWRK
ncbi:lactococcin 972 family bacteriocin [Actinosynnema sp. NPDC051121]